MGSTSILILSRFPPKFILLLSSGFAFSMMPSVFLHSSVSSNLSIQDRSLLFSPLNQIPPPAPFTAPCLALMLFILGRRGLESSGPLSIPLCPVSAIPCRSPSAVVSSFLMSFCLEGGGKRICCLLGAAFGAREVISLHPQACGVGGAARGHAEKSGHLLRAAQRGIRGHRSFV